MKKKIILDLFGGTGSWARPYEQNASEYEVYNITHPYYDVLSARVDGLYIIFDGGTKKQLKIDTAAIYGILAAPPCTEFSNLKTCQRGYANFGEGLKNVKKTLEIIEYLMMKQPRTLKFWAMENPYAKLRYFIGNPPLVFEPWEYGDPWSKKTAIWGFFNKPIKKPVKQRYIFDDVKNSEEIMGFLPTDYVIPKGWSKGQAIRSQTPKGFAKAFYEANR